VIRRIAYLAMHTSPLEQPGTGDAGGMNVYLHELAEAMARHGIEVTVFTRRRDPATPEVVTVTPGYRVVHCSAGPQRRLGPARLTPFVVPFAERVLAWITAEGASYDLVHSHYWLSGWAGVFLKEALGVPLANSFHTLGRVKDRNRRPGETPSSATRLLTEEEVIARCDCVIASTPYEFDDLLEHYGAAPERLCVSPPGIDHDVFHPGDRQAARATLGWGEEPVILFVGRIQAHKGPGIALRAHSMLSTDPPAPHLVLVGGPSGPDGTAELASLRRLADELGTRPRVRFEPAVPHRQLVHWYRAADVLVMPSRSESFGLVAAEAQATGLPVVASRVGGLRYVVDDAVSGLLVDGHQPAAFAAALDAVLRHESFRRRLAAGAVTFAERFSWKTTVERLLELYEGIVTSPAPARNGPDAG